MRNCPRCEKVFRCWFARPIRCSCGEVFDDGEQPCPVPTQNSEANWPSWAKVVAARRRDGEAGVGDTFDRLASRVGGKAFKSALKKLGIPCGCDGRQRDWNALYPYQ